MEWSGCWGGRGGWGASIAFWAAREGDLVSER